MHFLNLSGIPVPVSRLRYSPTLQGTKGRAFSGFPYSTVRRTLMTLTGDTSPMTLAEAWALRALVNGDGHSWSFEYGPVSSLGLMPSDNTASAAATEGGKYGNCLALPGGDGSSIEWTLAAPSRRTIMVWRYDRATGGTPAWHHYVLRYTDAVPDTGWKDGAVVSWDMREDIADWLEWRRGLGGRVRLVNRTAPVGETTNHFDDLVALPYAIPSDWPAAVFTAGAAFGELPYHRATGTGLHKPMVVLGHAGDGDAIEFFKDGTHAQGESFSVELMEVPA